ncbi:hypothetical protein RQP46_006351 [Phenoliferia psychrophenolica]
MVAVPTQKLNSGYSIPLVGLGCWMGKFGVKGENQEAEEMVTNALKAGYTSFDTANGYGNEEAVGRAIRNSGIPRESLFITTKLGFDHSNIPAKFEESLEQLGLDYIDLFLVHWPQALDPATGKVLPRSAHPTIQDTWAEMEKLLQTGKVRSIGVSNHSVKYLELLLETATVVPAVNQVEAHPFNPQNELAVFCREKGIHLTAYCPLGQYDSPILKDGQVLAIAQAHGKSAGQVLLSWGVQRGNWSVVPKSSNPEHLVQLSDAEMKVLGELHLQKGKYKNLCSYVGGLDVPGSVYGWTFEELGWDPKAFELLGVRMSGQDASAALLAMLNMGAAGGGSSSSSSRSPASGAFSPSHYATPLPSSGNSQYAGGHSSTNNAPSDLERIFGPSLAGLNRRADDSSPSSTASGGGGGGGRGPPGGPAGGPSADGNLKSTAQPLSISSLISPPPPSTPPLSDSPKGSSLNSIETIIDRSLLAFSHLSSGGSSSDGAGSTVEFDQPDWAPVGVDVVGQQQPNSTVIVNLAEPRAESIDPRKVDVTPVALFAIPNKWERGVRIGAWTRGLCYGTKHGKVRVIDRVYGSKLLLKGQAGALVDLAIAPAAELVPDAASDSDGAPTEVRAIASVGTAKGQHRLLVWKAPEEFQVNDPGYERTLDVVGESTASGPRFRLLRFHPLYPQVPVLAVALNDGQVLFLDLANPALAVAAQHDESIFLTIGKVAHSGADIVDMAFSPDGTAFAILSADHTYTIRHTHEPCEAVVESAPLPFPKSTAHELSCLAFVAAPGARPTALAVSSKRGTVVHFVPLGPTRVEDDDVRQQTPAIEFRYSAEDPSLNFGHMSYHAPSSTLFVSSSLRGSLFSLRLSFPSLPFLPQTDDDVGLLSLPPSPSPALSSLLPHITHLTEIPTPEPVLSFILDDTSPDPTLPKKLLSAVACHPAGVHSIAFRHARVDTGLLVPGGGDGDGSRRMSLEGSIHVQSEVVVEVDAPAPGDVLLTRSRSVSIKREPTVDIIEEELEPSLATPAAAAVEVAVVPEVPAAPIPSASPSKKNGKGKGGARSPKDKDVDVKTEDIVANAWATGSAAGAGGKKKGGGGGGGGASTSGESSSVEVVRELKKLEESLPLKIAKIVQQEMDKHAQRYDEDRALDQAADTTRQETMLKLVSTTLTKNTSKLVETTIKDQVRQQVVPAISKLVSAAMSSQVPPAITSALSTTLPAELERLFARPEITLTLARTIAASIAPRIQADVLAVVQRTVVPSLALSVEGAVEGVMDFVRREMVDVRKEIVREQSDALEETEREVHALRRDVVDLKGALARMETLILALQPSAPLPIVNAAASSSSRTRTVVSPPQPHPRESKAYQLPQIPRPSTPPAAYEDMFTNALQPDNDPEFTTLLNLVNYAPTGRVDALFPNNPDGQKSCISPAVVLSLAFRLAQVFGNKKGPLDDAGKRQASWIRKSLGAMDAKDEATRGYTPGIIERIMNSLQQRHQSLVRENDARGAELVRELVVYARSRLGTFAPHPGFQQ